MSFGTARHFRLHVFNCKLLQSSLPFSSLSLLFLSLILQVLHPSKLSGVLLQYEYINLRRNSVIKDS